MTLKIHNDRVARRINDVPEFIAIVSLNTQAHEHREIRHQKNIAAAYIAAGYTWADWVRGLEAA